ncbi:cell division protein FtsL [Succinivibrio dextrinosolvens]|uniref:cell division protein FtsL n=1 Tax=Succinivibrio dextrinosolvens TaxID=83771 RepID=UPI002479ECE0|nr:cell division protein FtsL [Succinivibrio dextrinosolvens]
MQESSALRKIEDNLPVEEEKEPQFGDRSTHKHKANSTLQTPEVTKIQISAPKEEKKEEKTVVTEVTEQRILRIANADNQNDGLSPEILAIPLYTAELESAKKSALVPTILKDVFAHSLSFVLILVATCLSVYKVHIVQQTRDITIELNEVIQKNELMHREWLSLLSEREVLTEYSVVRKSAINKLAMVQPKTEDEVVIDLR